MNHRDVNKVDETMDEIRDQMDIANEISDAISQPLGGETYDEVLNIAVGPGAPLNETVRMSLWMSWMN